MRVNADIKLRLARLEAESEMLRLLSKLKQERRPEHHPTTEHHRPASPEDLRVLYESPLG